MRDDVTYVDIDAVRSASSGNHTVADKIGCLTAIQDLKALESENSTNRQQVRWTVRVVARDYQSATATSLSSTSLYLLEQ